jgi:cytochrome P450
MAQLEPKRVAHRMVFLNDISLHSTAFMAQNFILDLFSTNPELGYIDALRKECEAVFNEAGKKWTRAAVIKLKLVDSAIRESMRMQPFAIVGLPRTVRNSDPRAEE